MCQGPRHPAVVVWCRVPGRIFHLDLLIKTIIEDADFAVVVVQDD